MTSFTRSSPLPLLSGFAEIDRHFAEFIARFGESDSIRLAAACLSRAVRKGHICLHLGAPPDDWAANTDLPWPTLDDWRRDLALSRAVAFASAAADTPLVLDAAGRLYLRRYFRYEQALAAALRRRAPAGPNTPVPPGADDQESAIETAIAQRLTVISGGPGTGKTTTVVRILGRLLQDAPDSRIALAAPTGKAAARLEQAVREGWARFAPAGPAMDAALARLPRASTLHRLLGVRPNSPKFRHHAGNPLGLDLLVLDEASMVPLPLMAKLFDALPEQTRVILLGDRDQLASVEPGSVLADIADAAGLPQCPLSRSLVVLRKNYRFSEKSAIHRLCEIVRAGNAGVALEIVRAPASPDFETAPLPPTAQLPSCLREPVLAGFGPFLRESDPARALLAFNRFRILCAVRQGPYGVEEINRQIQVLLRENGLIRDRGAVYSGMPVLITENDYQLSLFNGDIGILLPDPAPPGDEPGDRLLWAWFPAQSPEEPLRRIAPARLPKHEPAFATTIHKSQGSEFDQVLLLLPNHDSPILTRELIYTGLTRARNRVEGWFDETVFAGAILRRNQRTSGLRDALQSG